MPFCSLQIFVKCCNNTFEVTVGSFAGFFAELLQIADYFGEQDCYRRCQELLKACVNVKNVCDLYGFAIQYNARVS